MSNEHDRELSIIPSASSEVALRVKPLARRGLDIVNEVKHRQQDALASNRSIINPIDGAEMLLVPAGEYLMGLSESQIESTMSARNINKSEEQLLEMVKPQRPYFYKYLLRHFPHLENESDEQLAAWLKTNPDYFIDYYEEDDYDLENWSEEQLVSLIKIRSHFNIRALLRDFPFLANKSEEQLVAWLKAHPAYRQGSMRKEMPQHTVYLDDYYIYKNEVTVAQYGKFCREMGHKMPNAPHWGWQDSDPMVRVSWEDATAYAEWAGVVLPSEAQWEKAARGTDGRIYPWGNEWDKSNSSFVRSRRDQDHMSPMVLVGTRVDRHHASQISSRFSVWDSILV